MQFRSANSIFTPFMAAALASTFLGGLLSGATEPSLPQQESRGSGEQKSGTITGSVIYKADPNRPWRQARYYVKDRAKGLLAEAVVALDDKALTGRDDKHKPTTITVDQKDFQFTPETVTIRAGDSVKFLNSDKDLHNVSTFHRLHSFNVNMPAGGTHVERLDQAGNIGRPYQLGCLYHGAMHAWVYVFDHPYFQLTSADGRYRLENVPPGKYQLRMVHPAGQLSWTGTVEVKPGQTTSLDIQVSPANQVK